MSNASPKPATGDPEKQPYGAHAPTGFVARAIGWTRGAGRGWLGKKTVAVLRLLALRSLAGKPVDMETLGARMRLQPHNNLCDKRILFTPQHYDAEERAHLASFISGHATAPEPLRFVDIGANVGVYSLYVANLAGNGARILAIEPHPDIFARLTANIGFNPFGTIKAVAVAVADKPGELTMFLDPRNKGESSVRFLRSGTAETIKVPATSLVRLLADEGYDRIDALKIDVEGAEDLILEPFFRLAPESLWPTLVVLVDSTSRWHVDLRTLLVDKGYRELAHTRDNFVFLR